MTTTTEAQQPPSFPMLVSPDTLARTLNMSRHDLYRDVRTRRRPFVKLGRHVRFRLDDVAPALASGPGAGPGGLDAGTTAARGLLDVDDVAQLFDVHPKWVRRAAGARLLPVVHVGRWVRFRPADLAAFVAEHTTAARVVPAGAR